MHDRSYIVETEDGGVYRRNRGHLLKTNKNPLHIFSDNPNNIPNNNIQQQQQQQQQQQASVPNDKLLNEIEYAAKQCYNKDSVLAQKDFCDLAEFKWHELIDELLEQQPLLADVLLAVFLPTSKIGNTKSVQRLILVISTVFGMLMNTGYQELSVQLVSSKEYRNDFS
ncbi:hypothetical protein DPMN_010933 [Dreissena polymorpha]|uniref:Uncharacterized protein n=1 Tax=Dreissena polymorpha TaxID=45954 RepID=A0A9D4S1D7_DREPO|nr:hypothetical protein DPMN_010933 [Dreissena polymorpha]